MSDTENNIRDRSPLRREIINIMAIPKLEKFHIDSVPDFDGNCATLAIFIQASEYLLTNYVDRTNANNPQNEFLLRAIIGKLKGRALELVGSRGNLNNWIAIKQLLLRFFSDPRDEKCLLGDLLHAKQQRNESAVTFGNRCQNLLSLILTKLQLEENDINARQIKIQIYEKQALDAYLRGINNNLPIRLRKPDNLEQAISFVIEEENFAYSKNNFSINNNNNNANVNKPRAIGQHTFNASPHYNYQSNSNAPTYQYNKPAYFNSRPYVNNNFNNFNKNFNSGNSGNSRNTNYRTNNNTYRPFQSQTPFRQNQNYQNNSNRQTPNFNENRSRQFRPEPMDTSSGNSRRPQNNFNPPKFVSEELYQTEVGQNGIVNNEEREEQNFQWEDPPNDMT